MYMYGYLLPLQFRVDGLVATRSEPHGDALAVSFIMRQIVNAG